jgi:hypothetical protein
MTKKCPCEEAEHQRTIDAATVLMAFGPKAGAEALHHAFVSELASDAPPPNSGSKFIASSSSAGRSPA